MTLFIAIMWFCGAIFIGIGIFSFKKKEPMHFGLFQGKKQ